VGSEPGGPLDLIYFLLFHHFTAEPQRRPLYILFQSCSHIPQADLKMASPGRSTDAMPTAGRRAHFWCHQCQARTTTRSDSQVAAREQFLNGGGNFEPRQDL
jgi:hypothetical protein